MYGLGKSTPFIFVVDKVERYLSLNKIWILEKLCVIKFSKEGVLNIVGKLIFKATNNSQNG